MKTSCLVSVMLRLSYFKICCWVYMCLKGQVLIFVEMTGLGKALNLDLDEKRQFVTLTFDSSWIGLGWISRSRAPPGVDKPPCNSSASREPRILTSLTCNFRDLVLIYLAPNGANLNICKLNMCLYICEYISYMCIHVYICIWVLVCACICNYRICTDIVSLTADDSQHCNLR